MDLVEILFWQIGQTLSSEINGQILNCFSDTMVLLTKFRESGGV